MSKTTITAPLTSQSAQRVTTRSLRRTTVVVGAVAAAAVTAVAAVMDASGVSFEVEAEAIPLLGFAQMTFLGAVLGGLLLAGLNRYGNARHRFLVTTIALTVLSCVPSVLWPDDVASKVALVATHVVAAAIVVPALLRHARD